MENNNLIENKRQKSGIGGWLIMIAIGVVVSPIIALLGIQISAV